MMEGITKHGDGKRMDGKPKATHDCRSVGSNLDHDCIGQYGIANVPDLVGGLSGRAYGEDRP